MNFIKTYEAWKQDFTFPTILELLKDLKRGMISTNRFENNPIVQKEQLGDSLETLILNNPGGGGWGVKDSGHTYYDISYARIRDKKEHDFLIIFEDDKVVSVIYFFQDLQYKPYTGLFVVGDIMVIFCVGDVGGNLYIFNISNGISEQFSLAAHGGICNYIAVEGGEYLINLENDFGTLGPRIVCRERSSGQVSYFKCKRFVYTEIFSEPLKPDSRVTSSSKEWDKLESSSKPMYIQMNPGDDPEIYVSCEDCDGEGHTECSECGGEGSWECELCDGTGNCHYCEGRGRVDCEDCDSGDVDCESCGGSGEVDDEECSECHGEGTVDCENCGGIGNFECGECDGSGNCQNCDSGQHYCEYCEDGQAYCHTCDGEGVTTFDDDED